MAKFKNISGQDLWIPSYGIVKAEETVELPADFHNANFVPVTEKPKEAPKVENKAENKTEK